MQVVGMFALVASLIFVGFQMRQTQAIAIANQYQDRAAMNAGYRQATLESEIALAANGERVAGQILASEGWEDLKGRVDEFADKPEKIGFFRTQVLLGLNAHDNNHFQYQSGFLPEDTWLAYQLELEGLLEDRFVQFIWRQREHHFRPEFRRLVNDLIPETRNTVFGR